MSSGSHRLKNQDPSGEGLEERRKVTARRVSSISLVVVLVAVLYIFATLPAGVPGWTRIALGALVVAYLGIRIFAEFQKRKSPRS